MEDKILEAIKYIKQNEGCSLSQVAKNFSWTIGSTVNILNKAEERNMVYSIYTQNNGRTNRVFYEEIWFNQIDWNSFQISSELSYQLLEKAKKEIEQSRIKGINLRVSDKLKMLIEISNNTLKSEK